MAKSTAILYDAVGSGTLTLTGSWPSGLTGRVAITVTSETGHTDCAGSIAVGSESKTFSASGQRLTYTTYLTARPIIVATGLDCHILVEVLTTSGQPYQDEAVTAVTCRWTPTQKSFRNSMGEWETSDAEVLTTSSAVNVNAVLQFGNKDFEVKEADPKAKLSGREFLRKLKVVYIGPTPAARQELVEAIEVEGIDMSDIMLKSEYDTNADGKVDVAETAESSDSGISAGSGTGTGAQQTIAHGLDGTPNRIFVYPVSDPAGTVISIGTPDATNIYVTVTSGKTYAWQAEIR